MDCEDCRHLIVVGLHDAGPRCTLDSCGGTQDVELYNRVLFVLVVVCFVGWLVGFGFVLGFFCFGVVGSILNQRTSGRRQASASSAGG